MRVLPRDVALQHGFGKCGRGLFDNGLVRARGQCNPRRMKHTSMILEVFRAADVRACEGVMIGDPISFADELILDDVFQIQRDAEPVSLPIVADATGLSRKDAHADAAIHLDCCLTLMAPDGSTHEAIVLVETDGSHVADVYLLALGELSHEVDYRLVGIARQTATKRFAEAASGAFARGTRITLSDGTMRPIEDLSVGDLILTRDAGPQPITWVGQATLRATGPFAPVVITKGALNNDGDLVVRPDHRIFIYQRADHLGAGRAEVLIKARDLVDGSTVHRQRGGFVDYFQLIFDEHHIIYAEGIAAESHLVDPHLQAALPEDARLPVQKDGRYLDYEVKSNLIPFAEAAALLRKASMS